MSAILIALALVAGLVVGAIISVAKAKAEKTEERLTASKAKASRMLFVTTAGVPWVDLPGYNHGRWMTRRAFNTALSRRTRRWNAMRKAS